MSVRTGNDCKRSAADCAGKLVFRLARRQVLRDPARLAADEAAALSFSDYRCAPPRSGAISMKSASPTWPAFGSMFLS